MIHKKYSIRKPDVQTVKSAASGRERDIYIAAGCPPEIINKTKREYPCPLCGGDTRFRWCFEYEGAPLRCSWCGNHLGDVFDSVVWLRNCSVGDAIKFVADFIGISTPPTQAKPKTDKPSFDRQNIVTKTTALKITDKSKLLRTLRYEYLNGVGDFHVLVERLEFDDGTKSFRQSHWDIEQRRYISGTKGVTAVPWDAPGFKEASTIYWSEGEKKTVVLSEVMAKHKPEICCSCRWGGSSNFPAELAPWFFDKEVVIFADNDAKGEAYAHGGAGNHGNGQVD